MSVPIAKPEYFGYDELLAALEPYAQMHAMEVGGCRHARGWLWLDLWVMPTEGLLWKPWPDHGLPSRAEFAELRKDLYAQAERAIAVLEVAHFDHVREPEITIKGDSGHRLECRVRCEGTLPQ